MPVFVGYKINQVIKTDHNTTKPHIATGWLITNKNIVTAECELKIISLSMASNYLLCASQLSCDVHTLSWYHPSLYPLSFVTLYGIKNSKLKTLHNHMHNL